jgi:hypothetical protein
MTTTMSSWVDFSRKFAFPSWLPHLDSCLCMT